MNQGNLSRRGFMARSLAGLTALGLPSWYAQRLLAEEPAQPVRAPGANDRIVMGAIGVGTNYTRRGNAAVRGERGIAIMNDAMRQTGVQMVAVCDVDRHNRGYAAGLVNTHNRNENCRQHEDYRELLQNRDINAVTIGTPDHWHSMIAIAAMRAGKDVYCEKPLTLAVDEGKALVRVARETNRILQVGSQQRSDARFRLACELVRNGRIGRIRTVETRIGSAPVGGPFQPCAPPEGLNYDFWLGQAPRAEYNPNRVFYEFRWYYEYSGGKMTDWGAHHNDIAQWALGMDNSGPVAVQAHSGTQPSRDPNSYNTHPDFEVHYTYANGANGADGTVLKCMSRGENGVRFEGEDGKWIFVSRSRIAAGRGDQEDRRLLDEPLAADATRLQVSANHMGNFIECLRSRRAPICNVEVGHRSVTVCHLGTIALRRTQTFPGERLRWNPQEQQFVGNNDANGMLSRPMRAPWDQEWRRLTANS